MENKIYFSIFLMNFHRSLIRLTRCMMHMHQLKSMAKSTKKLLENQRHSNVRWNFLQHIGSLLHQVHKETRRFRCHKECPQASLKWKRWWQRTKLQTLQKINFRTFIKNLNLRISFLKMYFWLFRKLKSKLNDELTEEYSSLLY